MTCVAIAYWLAAFSLGQEAPPLPREMALDQPAIRPVQDPAQEEGYPPREPPAAARQNPSFIDLDWLEIDPGAGVAVFSSKYRTSPSLGLSLMAHAPLPWLSPENHPTGEYFGLFAAASFASIDRDLSRSVDHRRGMSSFYSAGLDYSVLRDSTWILVARAGALYAYYDGIADLHSGVGFTLGLTAGIQLSGKMGLTYNPDFLFGQSGSLIVMNTLGLLIQF